MELHEIKLKILKVLVEVREKYRDNNELYSQLTHLINKLDTVRSDRLHSYLIDILRVADHFNIPELHRLVNNVLEEIK